jgi:hypothetical protein
MTKVRIALATALMLSVFVPVSAAQAGDYKCTHTLAQYNEAVVALEALAAKARAQAEQNPLYESDVGYYASALRDATQCVRTLTPVVAASR